MPISNQLVTSYASEIYNQTTGKFISEDISQMQTDIANLQTANGQLPNLTDGSADLNINSLVLNDLTVHNLSAEVAGTVTFKDQLQVADALIEVAYSAGENGATLPSTSGLVWGDATVSSLKFYWSATEQLFRATRGIYADGEVRSYGLTVISNLPGASPSSDYRTISYDHVNDEMVIDTGLKTTGAANINGNLQVNSGEIIGTLSTSTQNTISTDNITEGLTNKFFTEANALQVLRSSIDNFETAAVDEGSKRINVVPVENRVIEIGYKHETTINLDASALPNGAKFTLKNITDTDNFTIDFSASGMSLLLTYTRVSANNYTANTVGSQVIKPQESLTFIKRNATQLMVI